MSTWYLLKTLTFLGFWKIPGVSAIGSTEHNTQNQLAPSISALSTIAVYTRLTAIYPRFGRIHSDSRHIHSLVAIRARKNRPAVYTRMVKKQKHSNYGHLAKLHCMMSDTRSWAVKIQHIPYVHWIPKVYPFKCTYVYRIPEVHTFLKYKYFHEIPKACFFRIRKRSMNSQDIWFQDTRICIELPRYTLSRYTCFH